jgi:hypothetical protein
MIFMAAISFSGGLTGGVGILQAQEQLEVAKLR